MLLSEGGKEFVEGFFENKNLFKALINHKNFP